MMTMDLVLVFFGIALGGFLKGATGVGAPIVGVPILAIAFGVPKAVAIFSVLNLLSNVWQSWAYRSALGRARFVWSFALAGSLGAVAGSLLLTTLPTEMLMGGLALVVFGYVALRLARPGWKMARARGEPWAGPAGFLAGVMQGAGGISAPISMTFLNAMRLERSEFIATISVFFMMMSVFQIPALAALGVLTADRLWLALLACVPLFGAMPLGAMAARHVSRETFDRLILLVLFLVAARLLYAALA